MFGFGWLSKKLGKSVAEEAMEKMAREAFEKAAREATEKATRNSTEKVVVQVVTQEAAKKGLSTGTKVVGTAVGGGIIYDHYRKKKDTDINESLKEVWQGAKDGVPEQIRNIPFGNGSLIVGAIAAVIGWFTGGLPIAILLGVAGGLGGQSLVNAIPSVAKAETKAPENAPETPPAAGISTTSVDPEIVVPTGLPPKSTEQQKPTGMAKPPSQPGVSH